MAERFESREKFEKYIVSGLSKLDKSMWNFTRAKTKKLLGDSIPIEAQKEFLELVSRCERLRLDFEEFSINQHLRGEEK